MTTRRERTLTLGEAVLPLVTMLVLFVSGIAFLEMDTELLIAAMLSAATVAGVIAWRHGHTWEDIQKSTGAKLADVLPAVLILLAIGMLIGTWVMSGTIPFLVYWGVRLISPTYLVLTAFLATAIMSLCTGTSWGSAGTIGVALMGTAAALDAPMAATAGAVVSGAYFGDKLSPLSDSTNISAIGAGAPLYTHIRHMLYTAVPSFVVAIIVYTLAARLMPVAADGLSDRALELLSDIDNAYALNWVVLIPPAIVIASIVRKVPPPLAMAASSVVAVVIGIGIQGFSLQDGVVSAVAGFRTTMLDGAAVWTDAFTTLVERGGLFSMSNTLIVIIAAFLLAGAMDVSGSLDLMINRMLATVRSIFGLIAATMAAGGAMIALTSHGGVTALVIGGLFQRAYRERDMAPENLSRSLEDSVTITEPLMPWTVSAVFMAGTLGVATTSYAPWAVFCYGGPFFSLLLAATYEKTGFGLTRGGDEERTR
ncbi:MAG: Na+/H+ antiporter NhaC [Acidobacteriota bacterium]|nr:MAG: Na+/H+ antiporter NhaC [Acidobacteriota bacterium]